MPSINSEQTFNRSPGTATGGTNISQVAPLSKAERKARKKLFRFHTEVRQEVAASLPKWSSYSWSDKLAFVREHVAYHDEQTAAAPPPRTPARGWSDDHAGRSVYFPSTGEIWRVKGTEYRITLDGRDKSVLRLANGRVAKLSSHYDVWIFTHEEPTEWVLSWTSEAFRRAHKQHYYATGHQKFVVRAYTKMEARRIAQRASSSSWNEENELCMQPDGTPGEFWCDPELSYCVPGSRCVGVVSCEKFGEW